jgi:hypothetical protein
MINNDENIRWATLLFEEKFSQTENMQKKGNSNSQLV